MHEAAVTPGQSTVATRGSVLDCPVETLAGVGAVRARQLKTLGIRRLADLLEYFPRHYRCESAEKPISKLICDEIQTVRGRVIAVDYIPVRPRPRFEATIDDGTDRLALVWFHGGYLRRLIHPGLVVRVRGTVKFFRGLPRMSNPKWEVIEADAAPIAHETFRPVYRASQQVSSDVIGRIIRQNLGTALQAVQEWFDAQLLKRRGLITRRDAYRWIHFPADERDAVAARRRLVYDELMLLQLALGMSKRLREARLSAPVMRVDRLLDRRIRQRFPFELTDSQQAAIWEIVRDLQSGRPMNRLLQGDVGSGKTVVALYAMLVAVANKMQTAILAPTEVLAEQHFLTITNLLKDSRVRIELFTSRTKREARGKLARALAGGEIDLAIGTQALIQEGMQFANLGLVVVDEQHKLGVRQRAILKSMGHSPHYLVMTATPIPRTLALSYFADFDLSTITRLPPGRQPITTRWFRQKDSIKAYEFLRKQVEKGQQAYIVLSQIDDNASDDAKSVLSEFERLSAGPLRGLWLDVLHGQMKPTDKQRIMQRFRAREIQVLVATTVIEVGIDLPNATVMLIENAERFGLSQLHQLRGRVGRGTEPSYCLLLSDATTEDSEQRLKAMTLTCDGFEIAEMDLKLRGPGEFFGTRQHGLPPLRMADVSKEVELLQLAKMDALELLRSDPNLSSAAHRTLRSALEKQFGATLPLAQVG